MEIVPNNALKLEYMTIELDYKGTCYNLGFAIADALGVGRSVVDVVVSPAKDLIPFRCDWRVVSSGCADVVAYVNGEILLLNIV